MYISVPLKVSCGAKHVLAVTAYGHLYAWGDNRHGQCGLSLDPLTDPQSPGNVDKGSKAKDKALSAFGDEAGSDLGSPGAEGHAEALGKSEGDARAGGELWRQGGGSCGLQRLEVLRPTLVST